MKLPEFSVKRKVTTAMLAMILVVLGLISYTRLGLDFFPDLEFPTVSVITTYSGASSEDIENTITRPLEQIINSVSGVKKLTSQTMEGASLIMVEFEWGTNLDFAAQDMRDQIGLYENRLPEGAADPLVVKFNLGQMPIIFGGIISDRPTFELKELIEEEVIPRLERIDGVASAQVFSTDVREILVEMDKAALESRNLSPNGLIRALRMENLNLPAGHIVERHSEFLVKTQGEFQNLNDIRNTIVGGSENGDVFYLKDVAHVYDTMKETRFLGRVQGEKGIFYAINKRSEANTVLTAEEVNKELAKIKETLPSDVEFYPFFDQSEMIREVIRRTGNNALLGGLLAVLFLLIFLRNWRPTVTIALAIPLSVITTFIAFYLAGYTINMLTLGGLALGIGMLVDNAVVVIENIFRHIEEKKGKNEAARKGASEVGMAITASTLTTIAVFFPMVFARGITGKLTQGLALAVAFSLLASLFVALTVVPMVASLLFKPRQRATGTERKKKSPRFEKARQSYRKFLHRALRERWWILGGTVGVFVLSLTLIPFIGTEFMPSMDREMIILSVEMPVGTSLQETDRVVRIVEEVMDDVPEVETVSVQVGPQGEEDPAEMAGGMSTTATHEALVWASLKEKTKRDLSDKEVLEKVRGKLPQLKDVKMRAVDMSQMMLGGAQAPVEIKLFGEDLDILKELADNTLNKIKDVPGLRDVSHSLVQGKPEYQISIHRGEASRMGLRVSQIANTVQTFTLGKVATRFREGNEEVDIRVQMRESSRDSLKDIKNIPIKTSLNKMVHLEQVASVSQGKGPIQINRENQSRVVTVSANIVGRDLGSVVSDIKARISGMESNMPPGYFLEFGGEYEDMQEAFLIMAGAFALATLLVYMIMASQFESFVHPFVIMFTIPMALIGVVFSLLITGRPVNLPVLIGFVMLGGIAVNNGIVMVDYINQLKRKGIQKLEAILEASTVRLRPVLITALTTILAMFPMALSTSQGAEIRAPMAITVIGGLLATTFLTLFVIPIIYSLMDRVKVKKSDES
ncbi:efflux RND transporter permease subunit [bacterium]|nr:efflux RND transporter permease subunit [bacterium]